MRGNETSNLVIRKYTSSKNNSSFHKNWVRNWVHTCFWHTLSFLLPLFYLIFLHPRLLKDYLSTSFLVSCDNTWGFLCHIKRDISLQSRIVTLYYEKSPLPLWVFRSSVDVSFDEDFTLSRPRCVNFTHVRCKVRFLQTPRDYTRLNLWSISSMCQINLFWVSIHPFYVCIYCRMFSH